MSDSSPLRFEDLVVATPAGDRTVLVVTPTEKIRVGRDRLDRYREGDRTSELDELVLERIREHDGPVDGVLLRSWDGENASWGLDEELDPDELSALGYHLVRGQLKLCRQAIVLGTTAVVSVELTPRDFDALLEGWRRLGRELRKKSELERNVKEDTDLFLIDHFTLWTTRPLEEFRDQALPSVFALAQRYRGRIEALRERLTERNKAMEASDD
jgi:hypothetical protein